MCGTKVTSARSRSSAGMLTTTAGRTFAAMPRSIFTFDAARSIASRGLTPALRRAGRCRMIPVVRSPAEAASAAAAC